MNINNIINYFVSCPLISSMQSVCLSLGGLLKLPLLRYATIKYANIFSGNNNSLTNRNTSICFPNYYCGKYPSLSKAVAGIMEQPYKNLDLNFINIIQYNVRYRDYLREYGDEQLIKLLLSEAPMLKELPVEMEEFHSRLKRLEVVASYDIQCYHIEDTFEVLGRKIHGLKELHSRTEIYAGEYSTEPHVWRGKEYAESHDGLHVGQLYMSYPKFDSYDWADDRSYQNIIIRDCPVTEEDMKALYNMPSGCNAIRVHEHIPDAMLPILYYQGDGKYMFLATKKWP